MNPVRVEAGSFIVISAVIVDERRSREAGRP
jgi:hypothetical protein